MRKIVIIAFTFMAVLSILTVSATGTKDADTKAATVTVMANWGGSEQVGFEAVLDVFRKETGIEVKYISDRDAEITVQTMIASGNPPDIMPMPRPGVVAQFARDGVILPLTSGNDPMIPMEYLQENYGKAIIDQGLVDGKIYGVLTAPNSKSTIWYRTDVFKNLDLEIPETWDELLELVDIFEQEGIPPLSMGGLDGWTLTDWFENIYVRVAGPENYYKLFVTHEIKWTDPTVVEAMERFRELITPTDKRLLGGSQGALSTDFVGGMDQMLRGESGLYFEGGFMGNIGEKNFPDMTSGVDFSFFLFPSINKKWGRPVVGGGGFWIVFNDRPEVRKLLNYLISPEALAIWAAQKQGSRLPASFNVSTENLSKGNALEAAQIANADSFVFDGSDMAPGAVGGDAMFTGLQNFISNPDDIMGVLEFIESVADTAY